MYIKHRSDLTSGLIMAALAPFFLVFVLASATPSLAQSAFCKQLDALLAVGDFRSLATSKVFSNFNEIASSHAKEMLTGYTDCRTYESREKGVLKRAGYICRAPYFHPSDKDSRKLSQEQYSALVDEAENKLVAQLKPCLVGWKFAGDESKAYNSYKAFTKDDLIIGYERTAPGHGYKESHQLAVSVEKVFGKFIYEQ